MKINKIFLSIGLLCLLSLQFAFRPANQDIPLKLAKHNITPAVDEVIIEGTAEPSSKIVVVDAIYQYRVFKAKADDDGRFILRLSADVVPHHYFVSQGSQTVALKVQGISKKTTAQMEKKVIRNKEKEKEHIEKASSYYDINAFSRILPKHEMYEVAHRGLESEAPENTVMAFKKAAQAKYPLVESDAQLTKDGHWVIMHDRKVNRTTNGHGYVEDMTFKKFRKLKIKENQVITRPPTVYEYLKTTKKNRAMPLLEIKTGTYSDASLDELVNMIRELALEEQMALISFDSQVLTRLRIRMPKIPMVYLFSDAQAPELDNTIAWCKKMGIAGLGFRKDTVTKEVIDKCHQNGLIVDVYTIKNQQEQQDMRNLGVDLITSSSLP